MVGTLIEGRFEVERRAGSGGMSVLFRALDRLDGKPVAIKLLRAEDAIEIERFEVEATVLADLRHPGIVRYISHGRAPSGEHYLAMEWLEGEDLGQRLARERLTLAESLSLLQKIAEALVTAHERGVLHRDIKPSNVFLIEGQVDRIKLLDFGIARLMDESRRLTRSGVLMGTPAYMAPEQVQGSAVHDPRADVFSLGCVLFECIIGRPVFEGVSAMAVLAKILLQEVPPLRELRPDVPEPIERLVQRMLSKDPAGRPRNAAEVVEAIEQLSDEDWRSGPGKAPTNAAPGARSSPAPAPGGKRALTLHEQRLVSVVLAGAPRVEDTSSTREIAAPVLEHFGGHLNVLADGSMVVTVWGAGSVVDRVERAARCALALQARFADIPICVVTGRGVVSARVVEGAVIDRAVSALRATRSDAIQLDRVTADMLGLRFLTEPDGDAFVLRGERSVREDVPVLLGKPTPCLGRSRELAILEGIFSGCLAEPAAGAALVVGAAGVGKSRLRREFIERLRRRAEPVEILAGRADSLGDSSPFGIIADAIRDTAGILDGEPLEVRRQKLTRRLSRHVEGDRLAQMTAFLGEICRTPFPDDDIPALRAARDNAQLTGDAMRAAWEDWLAAECAVQPVLLTLEDLHWSDAATIRLIDSTLRNLRDQPLMVLVLARPEVQSRFPGLWSEREVHRLRLSPLLRKASEQLVRGALGKDHSAELMSRIVDRADGNPFYLEELIRAVAAGRSDALPDSVLGTVEARLDAEGSEAKRVLRAASVFGERFSTRGVAALLGGEAYLDESDAWLELLTGREMITHVSTPGLVDDTAYLFRHALVREAAYATLTEADRVLGHRLAGAWLEESGHTDALTMAEHFSRGSAPARASRWYRRAAEQALEADDLPAVLTRAARGVACGAQGEDLGALRLVEAEAHVWRGELALAEQRAVEAAGQLTPGSALWFHAVSQAVIAAGKQGGFDRVEAWVAPASVGAARAQAERAAPTLATPMLPAQTGSPAPTLATPMPPALDGGDAPGPGAQSKQLRCLSWCATYLIFGGRYGAADVLLEELEPTADLDAETAALIYQARSFRASARGDSIACLGGLEEALAAFERAGDRRNACMTRSNLGYILAELGDFEGAEETLRGALVTANHMGLGDLAATVLHNLGPVLAYRGELAEARRVEQQAIETFHKQGAPRLEGLARCYLAKIELLAGDVGAAEREARAAAEALLATPPLRAAALAVLARAQLAQERLDDALTVAREAFSLLESLGSLEEGEALVRLVYAEALAARGDERDFSAVIGRARERLLESASRITDAAFRDRFLDAVPDHARTLALARAADDA